MDRNILYYGSHTGLPEQITLRAGPLELMYEQGDLRSICLCDQEILRRVYVAVRDRNWGTVAPVFSHQTLQIEPEYFHITFDAAHRAGEIDFVWHGKIDGAADGTISFRMDGTARSTFWKNRIGFCVLHPAGLSGQDAEVEHVDGSREQTQFSRDICADQPVQPFANLRGIRYPVMTGVWAEVSFHGDIFEMEDQRLWTDASYKTFCTPLSLPYPVQILAGTRVQQTVTIRLVDQRPDLEYPALRFLGGGKKEVHPSIQNCAVNDWQPMPKVGLETASHAQPLSTREQERLRSLHLSHLRVELRLSEPDIPERLQQAASQAGDLGIPLEVALAVSTSQPEKELSAFRRLINELRPQVCGWLIFPSNEPYTGGIPSEQIARLAYGLLKPYHPAIPLAVGTNTDFIFLKRTHPPLEWMDQVCISLNPQVHAYDHQSVLETLQAQPAVIESAHRLAQGKPVVVSPVTLKPRFNPYATGPQPQTKTGELPPEVDPRQMSLFAAGWTLGSLGAMVQARAARVTYYETTGWRGVMETERGSPLPLAFPSLPDSVFPLYFVLADYGEFAGGLACGLKHQDPARISALALRRGERLRYILANHTPEPLSVSLDTGAGRFAIRSLDESSAETTMQDPETFRQQIGFPLSAQAGRLSLELQPYGLLTVDPVVDRTRGS